MPTQAVTPPSPLHGSHQRTYEKIYQHPASHNLAWRDVLALFSHLGEVTVEINGNLKVTRNGHSLILPPCRTKDVTEVDELMKLRRFLDQSADALSSTHLPRAHMLVVIDHQHARLFSAETNGNGPLLVLAHALADAPRQAHPARNYFSGKEKPAPGSYFEPVAKALKGAEHILIFGLGTGASSEMEQFTAWLKKNHPELDGRITDTRAMDLPHLTDGQILAKARDFFRHPKNG